MSDPSLKWLYKLRDRHIHRISELPEKDREYLRKRVIALTEQIKRRAKK